MRPSPEVHLYVSSAANSYVCVSTNGKRMWLETKATINKHYYQHTV